jgi:hypothetical protein
MIWRRASDAFVIWAVGIGLAVFFCNRRGYHLVDAAATRAPAGAAVQDPRP